MLAVLTGVVVALTASMSLIRADYHYLWPGLVLLALHRGVQRPGDGALQRDAAELSTPETSGRVSGFGSAAGYFGSVLLLLIVYFGFIGGDGDTRGCSGLPADDGQNVRGWRCC